MFMPLALLAQYQHCIMRKNNTRTTWTHDVDESGTPTGSLEDRMKSLREMWLGEVDSHPEA
jgi:hypothetical protein